jgi:hypothetical protein
LEGDFPDPKPIAQNLYIKFLLMSKLVRGHLGKEDFVLLQLYLLLPVLCDAFEWGCSKLNK